MDYVSPKKLHEWGLIFEINRRMLHPLGMALAVIIDDEGDVSFSNEVWDCRDDPEGFLFEEKTFAEAQERFFTFLAEQGEDILNSRKKNLGFIIQGEEDEE